MNDNNQTGSWKRMCFKTNKVWAAVDANGNLLNENGKVLIKYNLKQDYEYKVKAESLKPEDKAIPAKKKTMKKSVKKNKVGTDLPDNCIKIYTDGASSGNPGPAGIGVVFIHKENKKQISEYIGTATNNIAELTAIKTALEKLKRTDLPVRIFSDSSYCIGVLTKNWKTKKNQSLVFEIKTLMKKFFDLAFIKVKGHSGMKGNELADFLATSAIKKDLK